MNPTDPDLSGVSAVNRKTKTSTMTKIIELRPDKNLIDQNFEKYQYSSDIVITDLEKTLARDVYRQEPGNTQDSWLEARVFAFHNHLFKNPFDSSCWYVDDNRDVWRLSKDGDLTLRHSLAASQRETRMYNPSISFASGGVAVLTGGGETLEVLVENSTDDGATFRTPFGPGLLLDARYFPHKRLVKVVACSVNEVDGKKCSRLAITSYEHGNERELKVLRTQVLNVKGPVEYACLEESGDHLHSLTQDTATFVHDSSKPVETRKSESSREENEPKIPKYCWSQDEDALTVWIEVADKCHDDVPRIEATATAISVSLRGIVLVQGDLPHRLDPDLTTWSRDKDAIKLELVKHESGLMWNELIRGDTGGRCLPDESLAAEIHSRLSHLCTDEPEKEQGQPLVGFNADQLEECDLQERNNFLQRIDLDDHTTTHLAMLGSSNHVLFTHKLTYGQRICLRHDHHGCVWIPRDADADDWHIEHVDTFPGFGYVEASKTNKKFCVSPPNGSYVAIVEHTRHAFLYEKPEGSAPIARQRIVDIGPDATPIMGAVATNKHLVLLTTNKLYRLVVYP